MKCEIWNVTLSQAAVSEKDENVSQGWALVQRGARRWPQEDSSFLNCSNAVRGNFKSGPKNKDSCCGALSLFKGLTTTCRERESQLPKHAVLCRPNQIHPLPSQLRLLRKWHIPRLILQSGNQKKYVFPYLEFKYKQPLSLPFQSFHAKLLKCKQSLFILFQSVHAKLHL